jgi:bloom syndrome protein
MQFRSNNTPLAKTKAKKTAAKNDKAPASKYATGALGAMGLDHYPQSTNVSSPVAGASRRRNAKILKSYENDDVELDGLGYARDGFVTSDNSNDESDGFAPVRDATKHQTKLRMKKQLGPPITSDDRITEANLTQEHQHFVNHFMEQAKKIENKIRNEKDIRKPLFRDTELREMAINWTLTIGEMLKIPGINTSRVKDFGGRFIPVLQQCHDDCEEMIALHEDRDIDIDTNHRNVIEILSSSGEDEYGSGVDEEDLQGVEGQQEELAPSRYFLTAAQEDFNGRLNAAQAQVTSRRAKSPQVSKSRANDGGRGKPPWQRKAGKGSSSRASSSGGNSRKKSRNTSGGSTGVYPSGVTKKSAPKRLSNGSSGSAGNSKFFQSYSYGGGGGGRFGAAPTGT